MCPSNQDRDVTKGVINGPRPLPLKINKHSHVIHKPPSAAAGKSHCLSPEEMEPLVFFTHSPRIIQVEALDFMAIVQSLTGFSPDDGDSTAADEVVKEEESSSEEKDSNRNDTTSVLSDDHKLMGSVKPEALYNLSNAFMDAPIYATPSEYFCSARRSSVFQSPNMAAGSFMPPSIMDYVTKYEDC